MTPAPLCSALACALAFRPEALGGPPCPELGMRTSLAHEEALPLAGFTRMTAFSTLDCVGGGPGPRPQTSRLERPGERQWAHLLSLDTASTLCTAGVPKPRAC